MNFAVLPTHEGAGRRGSGHVTLVERQTPFGRPTLTGLDVEASRLHDLDEAAFGKVLKGASRRGAGKADFILANPPFNISDWGGDRLREDVRWKYGIPPAGNANFAWVQHIVHHLSPSGVAGVVLANGSMSSTQNSEGEIRRALIEGVNGAPERDAGGDGAGDLQGLVRRFWPDPCQD